MDFKHKYQQHEAPVITSVFIGGGTPSLIPGQEIQRLFDGLHKLASFSHNCEITLEANPGSFDQSNFNAYLNAGINRLSVGVQSFSNQQLKCLGRMHSAQQASDTITHAQNIGFDNINIDLMYGLPQQTVADALEDVSKALALDTQHLSTYQLTIEPNTLFHVKPPKGLVENDLAFEMQTEINQLLQINRFMQYEVSAHAQKSKQTQHNLNYWTFGDYIAIGAGAHGKVTNKLKSVKTAQNSDMKISRYMNYRQPEKYMVALKDNNIDRFIQTQESINNINNIRFEFLMNALRLKNGFSLSTYTERTGDPANHLMKYFKDEELLEFLTIETTATNPRKILRVKANPKAYDFLDEILSRCLPND